MLEMQPTLENPQAVGQYLREVRESLGIPVRQVSDHLYIRLRYIEAMEAGRFDALPGAAYARGYVQKYAEYLGVGPTLAAFIEVPEKTTTEVVGAPLPTQTQREFFIPVTAEKPKPPQLLWWGIGVLLLLLVYAVVSGIQKDAPLPTESSMMDGALAQVAAAIVKPAEMPDDYEPFVPEIFSIKGCAPRFLRSMQVICYWADRSTAFGLRPVQKFSARIHWVRMELR